MRSLPVSALRRRAAPTFAVAMLVTAAACSDGSAAVNQDLERDLAAARAASIELAPSARRTEVVSAVERVPVATPATVRGQPAPQPRATAPKAAAVPRTAQPAAAQAEVAATPDVAEQGPPAPRPQPIPKTAERRGPYKTVGEVIRDAPFPINP